MCNSCDLVPLGGNDYVMYSLSAHSQPPFLLPIHISEVHGGNAQALTRVCLVPRHPVQPTECDASVCVATCRTTFQNWMESSDRAKLSGAGSGGLDTVSGTLTRKDQAAKVCRKPPDTHWAWRLWLRSSSCTNLVRRAQAPVFETSNKQLAQVVQPGCSANRKAKDNVNVAPRLLVEITPCFKPAGAWVGVSSDVGQCCIGPMLMQHGDMTACRAHQASAFSGSQGLDRRG